MDLGNGRVLKAHTRCPAARLCGAALAVAIAHLAADLGARGVHAQHDRCDRGGARGAGDGGNGAAKVRLRRRGICAGDGAWSHADEASVPGSGADGGGGGGGVTTVGSEEPPDPPPHAVNTTRAEITKVGRKTFFWLITNPPQLVAPI